MALNALLTQYNQKLLYVLNGLEDTNASLIKSSINRIDEYSKKLEKSIMRQAYISGATGLAAGLVGAGAAFMPEVFKVKQVIQTILPNVISKGGEFVGTFERAKETRLQMEERLLQDHLLLMQRESKNKYEEARHTMEQKISNCMDLKAQGDRLH